MCYWLLYKPRLHYSRDHVGISRRSEFITRAYNNVISSWRPGCVLIARINNLPAVATYGWYCESNLDEDSISMNYLFFHRQLNRGGENDYSWEKLQSNVDEELINAIVTGSPRFFFVSSRHVKISLLIISLFIQSNWKYSADNQMN